MSLFTRQQQTIAAPVAVEGFGYWSGRDVRVEFRPAAPGSGVVFVRTDLDRPQRIAAVAAQRVEAVRRTNLACGDCSVEMVEHVLAALLGLQVDNCEVWVNGAEMPGCDGSSLAFVDAIQSAGIQPQDAVRPQLVVDETVRLQDGECWIEARPGDKPSLVVAYELDYGPVGPIKPQRFELELNPRGFVAELAPARTFILEHEAQLLRDRGLGLRVGCSDLLLFDESGPVENELRFPDECSRHKALDVVGDLALAGCDIVGRVVAHRTGHRHNAALVGELLKRETCASGIRCPAA